MDTRLPPRVRLPNVDCHSWSGPLEHFHHTFFSEPATIPSGVRFPFLVGCHWLVISGYREVRELVTDALNPRQNGHPVPPRVRLSNVDCHSWSGPFGHFHQYILLEPATTWSALRSPFLVGCHSSARSGWREARELVTDALDPRQNGHPFPDVLSPTVASHSWSGPFGHFHQHFLCDLVTTWSGVNMSFFAGCHCFTRSRKQAANEFFSIGLYLASDYVTYQ
jgi:hypothetical protein